MHNSLVAVHLNNAAFMPTAVELPYELYVSGALTSPHPMSGVPALANACDQTLPLYRWPS